MSEFPCAPFEEVFIGNPWKSDCYRGSATPNIYLGKL